MKDIKLPSQFDLSFQEKPGKKAGDASILVVTGPNGQWYDYSYEGAFYLSYGARCNGSYVVDYFYSNKLREKREEAKFEEYFQFWAKTSRSIPQLVHKDQPTGLLIDMIKVMGNDIEKIHPALQDDDIPAILTNFYTNFDKLQQNKGGILSYDSIARTVTYKNLD